MMEVRQKYLVVTNMSWPLQTLAKYYLHSLSTVQFAIDYLLAHK